jgi:hypothetical protein
MQIRAQMIRHLDHVMAERGLVPLPELLLETELGFTSTTPQRGSSVLYSTPHRSRSYYNPYTPTFSRATLPPASSSPSVAFLLSESEEDDVVRQQDEPDSGLSGQPSPTKRLKRYGRHNNRSSPPTQSVHSRGATRRTPFDQSTNGKRDVRRIEESLTRYNSRPARSLGPDSSEEEDRGESSRRRDWRSAQKPRLGSVSSSLPRSSYKGAQTTKG